ncbi:MAG TPA: hypothetical protein VLB69_02630 [Rudaea sp.]|nr:hypothetical protein [Rudaea sp.]
MVTCNVNHRLRQALVFVDVPAMPQPEACIGGADKLLDAEGNLVNPATREFLGRFMNAFAGWIEHNARC